MNHSKATAAKRCQTPTPWHKARGSLYVRSGLWLTSLYPTKTHNPSSMHLLGREIEVFFSHEMGFDLIKRTLQVEIPKGFVFSNHHLPIFKTGIFIHPLVMKKQETKVCKKEWWKGTEKTQECLVSVMSHRGCYLQPDNKIKTAWNYLIPDEISATDKPEKKLFEVTYSNISRNVPAVLMPCQVTDGALTYLEI